MCLGWGGGSCGDSRIPAGTDFLCTSAVVVCSAADNVIVGDRSHEYAVLFTPMISASLHKLPNLRWDCVNHFET